MTNLDYVRILRATQAITDAVLALQSMDDLGSPEQNLEAMADIDILQCVLGSLRLLEHGETTPHRTDPATREVIRNLLLGLA